mgnify:CR=1 FL=1
MSFVEVEAGRLYYETVGAGAPLVCLHGFALDSRMWADQAAALAGRFQVIGYDLRGFGRSSLPAGPFAHVDDLSVLLDRLGLPRAHVMGLSLGGGVAIDFALAYPERVASLIAVDSTLGGFPWTKDWSPPGRAARSQGLAAARSVWLEDELFAPAMTQPAVAARLRQMAADYSGWHWLNRSPERPLAGGPAYDRLGAIRAPALVVVGELDLPDFHRLAGHLAAHLPDVRRVVLPGVGHMSNMEAPAAFNAALLEFLETAPTP